MTTRSVLDTLRHADGTPWQSATVTFTLTKGSYTGGAAYPPDTVVVTTDEGGGYSATLWCDEEGVRATRYQVTHPNGESFKIDLPVGDGSDVAMSALRAASPAVAATNLQTLLDEHTAESDPHPQYLTETEADLLYDPIGGGGGGGVTDHGDLTGLADDDHTQYHTDARGDARYWQLSTDLATQAELDAHAADTTSVHGITDTAALVLTSDSRLSDSRTPTAHASSHAAAGSDALTLSQSQIANLVSDLANKQPLDSDLTAIAALSITAFGRALLELADAPALRTAAGLGSLAVLSAITASLISDASANGRSLITAADYAAMRTLLGLVIGTDVQAYDAELAALAGLVSAANKIPYFTGSGSAALADLTAFARTLLDDADASAARATLGAAASVAEGRPAASGTSFYNLPGVDTVAVATISLTVDTVRYEPIYVVSSITIDQIAVNVATAGAAGKTARLGIYNADANWQPASLVVDGGTVAVDSTGTKSVGISTTLAAGRYLLAINSDGTPVMNGFRGGARYFGYGTSFTNWNVRATVAQTYAAFPSTGTAYTLPGASGAAPERVMLVRVSTP